MNKKIVYIGIFVLMVVSAMILRIANINNNDNNNNNNESISVSEIIDKINNTNSDSANEVVEEECSTEPVIFTESFVEKDKVESIGPIGALDGGSHGRSYVQVAEGGQVEVYAPTDATLEHVVYAIRNPESKIGEYGLWFRASCDVTFLLDHIDKVSDEIAKLAPTTPSKSSAVTGPSLQYEVKAGDLLGYTDGTPGARTFDFIVFDKKKKVEYINQDRFKWDQNLYSQCPYDYYEKNLREYFYTKLPEPNKTTKNCGSPSYDIAGSASGAWFQGEDTDVSGRWLTFGTYTGYSALTIRTDAARDFSIRDYDPSIKPEEMNVGDEVCYSNEQNWVYAHLDSEDQLSITTGEGVCPDSFTELELDVWVR